MRIVALFFKRAIIPGADRRFVELVRGLSRRGHTILLACDAGLSAAYRNRFGDTTAMPVELSSSRGPMRLLSLGAAASRWYAKYRESVSDVDVILTFGADDVLAGRILSRRTGAAFVLSVRSNFVEAYDQYRRLFVSLPRRLKGSLTAAGLRLWERFTAWATDSLVFQTSRDANGFMRRTGIAEGRVHVVQNSIRASWFDPALRGSNQSSRLRSLIFVGKLSDRKGCFPLLLEALRVLLREGWELTLQLVGNGGLGPRIRSFVEANHMQDRVTLRGFVSNPLPLLGAADLLVVPSLWDSFPNVVLEAFFVGTPVIGSQNGGIPEMIGDPHWVFDPLEQDTLVRLLRRLVAEPDAYASLKAHCVGRAAAYDFDWAKKFENVLSAIKGARSSPPN